MSRYRNTLTTLEQVRRFLGTTEEADDTLLKTLIRNASAQVEKQCGRVFVPYKATLDTDVPLDTTLFLPDDLLILDSIEVDGEELVSTDYVLLDKNQWPYYAMMPIDTVTFNLWDNTPFQSIPITGTWGYNTNPSEMFEALDVTLTAGVNATVKIIPVSALTDIETFSYIYVDDELMQVLALVTTDNDPAPDTYSLTVKRGANGYTAAAHLTDAVVSIYGVDTSIEYAATHYTLYLYQTRDNFGEKIQVGNRDIVMSKQLPDWVQADLDNMTRIRFYTPGMNL